MDQISTIRDVINLWPTRATLADQMSEIMEEHVSVHRVHKWSETGSIPAKFHYALLRAAERGGYPVTPDLIIRLHAPKRGAA